MNLNPTEQSTFAANLEDDHIQTAPGVLSLYYPLTTPGVAASYTMMKDENQFRFDAEPENENDGGEPTPPSQPEEPVAKPEPLAVVKCSDFTSAVSQKPKGDIFDDLTALGRTVEELTPSEKLLTSLPLRKPKKDEWIRCHPVIHAVVNVYESSDTRDVHLVLPAALETMGDVVKNMRLRLAVTYAGEAFVWPVTTPSLQKPMVCHVTAATAAKAAETEWIRIGWKTSDYEVHRRIRATKEPEWPTEITTASEMLRFISKTGGFEVIDSPDHTVVRALRGLD